MARIRTIKPEFYRSPDTAKASHTERLLYTAMWCWADDWGYGETNLNGLLGMAFPDEDGITRDDLVDLLRGVREAYGVIFYTVRGRRYYCIPAWDQHQKTQRRASARFPHPDDPESGPDLELCAMRGSSVRTLGNTPPGKGKGTGEREQGNSGELTLVEGVKGETPAIAVAKKPARKSRIPDGWAPSADVANAMMAEIGCNKQALIDEHKNFYDYWVGEGGTKADWTATWRGWMRRAAKRGELRGVPGAAGRPLAPNDQKIADLQAMKDPE